MDASDPSAAALLEPSFEFVRLHGVNPSDHAGVLGSAVFRAEQVVFAGFGRLKPECGVARRQHVLLHPKCGDEEAVNHVLRGHHQPDRLTHRNMQRIDLALPVGILQLPHPLLGDDVNFTRIRRRLLDFEVEFRAPGEHSQKEDERYQRPCRFHFDIALDLLREFVLVLAVIAKSPIDQQDRNRRGDRAADGHQHPEEPVPLGGKGGCGIREQLERVHEFGASRTALRPGRKSLRKRGVASETIKAPSIRAAAARSRFITAAPYFPVDGS